MYNKSQYNPLRERALAVPDIVTLFSASVIGANRAGILGVAEADPERARSGTHRGPVWGGGRPLFKK